MPLLISRCGQASPAGFVPPSQALQESEQNSDVLVQLALATFEKVLAEVEKKGCKRAIHVPAHWLVYGTTAAGEERGFSKEMWTGFSTHSHCW